MTELPGRRIGSLLPVLLVALLAACSSGPRPAPQVGESLGGVPPLRGATVLLLPVQRTVGVGGGGDAELAYALRTRGAGTEWIEPEEIRRVTGQSVMEIPIDRLPIEMFFRAEVDRVGDPIYGFLRRIAALTDAEIALIPLAVSAREETEERPEAIEVMATLIDIRTGRVYWIGTEEGVGDPGDPGTLAQAMESLARKLHP